MVASGTLTSVLPSASAQVRRFKVTPIRAIGFTPNEDVHGYAGINKKGQVVYGYSLGGFPTEEFQAFVWLPETDYGFTTPWLHELDDCEPSSIARDINESGFVVGQADGVGVEDGNAAVWVLDDGESVCTLLGVYSPADNPYSSAFAVSDDEEPVVVGQSALKTDCGCDNSFQSDVERAFQLVFDGSTTALTALSAAGASNAARDVATPGTLIVGWGDCVTGEKEGTCPTPGECQPWLHAGAWVGTLGFAALNALDDVGERALGVNDNGEIVGWNKIDLGGIEQCFRRATYWAAYNTGVVNLGNIMPDGQDDDASVAIAVNNLADPQVVGLNQTEGNGLLWENGGSSTSWTVLDLNSSDAIGAATNHWDIAEGHDINDNGWIVASGLWQVANHPVLTEGEVYLVLLTPVEGESECLFLGDVNDSGCIDNQDLLDIIAAWGSCPVGQFCNKPEDVNLDYLVNMADLLTAIANYCGEGDCCANCPEPFGPNDPPDLQTLIEMVLESDHPAEVQEAIIAELMEQFN